VVKEEKKEKKKEKTCLEIPAASLGLSHKLIVNKENKNIFRVELRRLYIFP
jgi:hypothetical protein